MYVVGEMQVQLGEDVNMEDFIGLDVYNKTSRDNRTFTLVKIIKSFCNAIGQT